MLMHWHRLTLWWRESRFGEWWHRQIGDRWGDDMQMSQQWIESLPAEPEWIGANWQADKLESK